MPNDSIDLTDVVLEIADSYDIPGSKARRMAEAVADEVERRVRERIAADIKAQSILEPPVEDTDRAWLAGMRTATFIARGGADA